MAWRVWACHADRDVRPAALLLTLWLVPSVASAGNGDGVLVGNEAAMTGGAVAATVQDGSAAWYNPAGLADMRRDAVDVSGNAFQLRAAEEGGLLSSTTGEENDGGYLELVSIPSASTIARRFDPNVVLAFGVFVPRFTQHQVRTGLNAGTARWTLSSTSFRASYHAGGAIGIRVDDRLRIGFSLLGVYRERSDTFQTAGQSILPGETRVAALGGISQLRSLGAELAFGLQWEPHPGVVIAATLRSPGLEILTQVRSTSTELDVTVRPGEDIVEFEPTDEETLGPAVAVLTSGRLNFAIAHRFDRGWVALEIDVQPPLDEGVISRRFLWNVRAGGRYEIDANLGIGVGVFTDQSEGAPITELGETRVDFYGLSAGFEYRTSHLLAQSEAAPNLVFSTTVALRYAIGFGEVGGLLFDPNRGIQRATVPIGTTIQEIGLHIGSALYF